MARCPRPARRHAERRREDVRRLCQVAPGTATLATVRPYVDHVIDGLRPDRCLWGSDWPVVNVHRGNLPNWIAAFREILAGFSEAEQAAMAHGTAKRVYKRTAAGRGRE